MSVCKKRTAARVLRIAAVCLLLNIFIDFAVTKAVYDGIFSRYESESCPVEVGGDAKVLRSDFLSGKELLCGRLYDGDGDALVVIAQGMNSCVGGYGEIIEAFISADLDVFAFDMKGSCESEGESSVGFSQGVEDLESALSHIEKEFDYSDIFLFGHSRGGYSACCVLEEREDIDGVIAVSAPNSPMEAVMGPSVARVGALAYGNYPMLWLYQAMLFGDDAASLCASDVVKKSRVPVLVIQGRDDEVAPADKYSLYSHRDEVTDKNAIFCLTDGDHSSLLYDGNDGAVGMAIEFIDEILNEDS